MIQNYNDLPLGKYLEIDKAVTDEALEELDKQVRIIAILADIPVDDILDAPLGDYANLAAQTAFLREQCPHVTPPARVIVGTLVLEPVKDVGDITTAQYIDFQTFSRGGMQSLPELLSALLIPEGHKYNDGYDLGAVKEAIRSLPVPVALSLSAFFFNSFLTSITNILNSLEKEARETRNPETRAKIEVVLNRAEDLLAGAGLQI